jgi:hypothetical protein
VDALRIFRTMRIKGRDTVLSRPFTALKSGCGA